MIDKVTYTKANIDLRRLHVSDLYLGKKTQFEIGQLLDVDQATISRDLKALRKQWMQSSTVNIEAAKAQELAATDRLEREYWRAWHESKQNKEITTTKAVESESDKKGDKTTRKEANKREEGQVGDARFLAGVQWCIDRRIKLLNLDTIKKIQLTTDDDSPLRVEIVEVHKTTND